jgi:integrase
MRPRAEGPKGGKPLRFESNQQMHEVYLGYVRQVHSTSTVDKAFTEVRKFLEYFGDRLVLDLSVADLIAYVEVYEMQCTHFRRGGMQPRGQTAWPNWCAKKQPLACQGCPFYEGMKAVTTEHHLTALAALYSWLADNFLRAGEVARLKVTPRYLDPNLEWIIIPLADGNDGKRIVEVPYPIDLEMRKYLRAYLRWRAAKLARNDKSALEALVITHLARPFTADKDVGDRLTKGLRREAARAGIRDPDNLRSHCLRYFASDRAQALGVHGNELKLLRGDWLEGEATGSYIDTNRLRDLYAKGADLWACATRFN